MGNLKSKFAKTTNLSGETLRKFRKAPTQNDRITIVLETTKTLLDLFKPNFKTKTINEYLASKLELDYVETDGLPLRFYQLELSATESIEAFETRLNQNRAVALTHLGDQKSVRSYWLTLPYSARESLAFSSSKTMRERIAKFPYGTSDQGSQLYLELAREFHNATIARLLKFNSLRGKYYEAHQHYKVHPITGSTIEQELIEYLQRNRTILSEYTEECNLSTTTTNYYVPEPTYWTWNFGEESPKKTATKYRQ